MHKSHPTAPPEYLHATYQSTPETVAEICAWVVLRKLQTTGVTSKMETRYMKPVNTNDSYIVLKASIKERKRNIVFVEAAIYNNKEELCTKALCTYFTFPQEKAKEEMHFLSCEVEQDEIIPLI